MQDMLANSSIGPIIQLSVAPVFLLVAIGSILNVVTSRLGRVVDRARLIEEALASDDEAMRALHVAELHALDKRISRSNLAINLSVVAALMIAFVVPLLFIGDLAGVDTSIPVAILFVLAMAAIIGGLVAFLAEISVATRTLRIRSELLSKK